MCVLKEFSPNDRGRDALKKSKELFQREAQVLYQINHPQIPKFRANFEEQKRLFLVQEYAEGKTVARALSERLKNSKTFTEAEAVEFLLNMLPSPHPYSWDGDHSSRYFSRQYYFSRSR